MKTLRERIEEELGDMTGKGYSSFIKSNFGDLRTPVAKEMAEEWLAAQAKARREANSKVKAAKRNHDSQVLAESKGIELLQILGGSYEYVGVSGFVVDFKYLGDVCLFGTYQYQTLREALRASFMKALDTVGFKDAIGIPMFNELVIYLGERHMIEEVPDIYEEDLQRLEELTSGLQEVEELTSVPQEVEYDTMLGDTFQVSNPETVEAFEDCFKRNQVCLTYKGYDINLYEIAGYDSCFFIQQLDYSGKGFQNHKQAYRTAVRRIDCHLNQETFTVRTEADYYPDSLSGNLALI